MSKASLEFLRAKRAKLDAEIAELESKEAAWQSALDKTKEWLVGAVVKDVKVERDPNYGHTLVVTLFFNSGEQLQFSAGGGDDTSYLAWTGEEA